MFDLAVAVRASRDVPEIARTVGRRVHRAWFEHDLYTVFKSEWRMFDHQGNAGRLKTLTLLIPTSEVGMIQRIYRRRLRKKRDPPVKGLDVVNLKQVRRAVVMGGMVIDQLDPIVYLKVETSVRAEFL